MKRVEIEWIDSTGTDAWHGSDDFPTLTPCKTIAYLIAEKDDGLLVASTVANDNKQYMASLVIPWQVIKAYDLLEVK
jgi:hypothetical protein